VCSGTSLNPFTVFSGYPLCHFTVFLKYRPVCSGTSLTPLNNFLTVSLTPAINFRLFGYLYRKDSLIAGVVDTAIKHSFANISANFRKKVEMILMDYSGVRGTLIHEKKLRSKISCQTPFNKIELYINVPGKDVLYWL
jgi:hypothetical protein